MTDNTRDAVENLIIALFLLALTAIPLCTVWYWAVAGMASEIGFAWLVTWFVVVILFVLFGSAVDEARTRRDRDRNGWH